MNIYIIDHNELISDEFALDDEIINQEKKFLINLIEENFLDDECVKTELVKAIMELKEIEPLNVGNYIMVKTKFNKIKIDYFSLDYLKRDSYLVKAISIPVPAKHETINDYIYNDNIKELSKQPKISLRLNPDITKEQVEKEKSKTLEKKIIYKV